MFFVLVPGAGGAGWLWHRVVPLLQAAGHDAVAIDLPADDPAAGLPEYADLVSDVVGGADDVVLVGQSLGGFTVPIVAERLAGLDRTAELVLLNAMIPLPGETPGEWWEATGQNEARLAAARAGGWTSEVDLEVYFLHDVDPVVAATGESEQRPESDAVFTTSCAIDGWPEVRTRVIAGADDRFFPLAFQQRLARERLGLEPIVVPGGHLNALSYPEEFVAALLEV